MEKRKQRVISIIIGLILASLLIYIGVRVVQQRGTRASQPERVTADRKDNDTCELSAITLTDNPVLFRYGNFYYRMEQTDIAKQADGAFLQKADVNNISPGQVTFIVEGHEEMQAICDPFTNSAGTSDTNAGTDPLLEGNALNTDPEPTTEPEAEADPTPAEPEPTTAPSISKSGLTRDMADEFFADPDNDEADFIDCIHEFEDDYRGTVQVCNEAWRAAE